MPVQARPISLSPSTSDSDSMPFERYLQQPLAASDNDAVAQPLSGYEVPFQMPQFMHSGPPIIAPGGGAEVLPAGMLSDQYAMNNWFANNGFTPMYPQYHSPARTRNEQGPRVVALTPATSTTVSTPSITTPRSSYLPASASSSSDVHVYSPPAEPPLAELIYPSASKEHAEQQLQSLVVGIAQGSTQNPLSSSLSNTLQDTPIPPLFPLYSASGFDLLSVMARLHTRRNPTVHLGPVDMTSSFVVVDVRRHDHPIIYCSPNFCALTGYEERECVGKNCRFLQAPDGQVRKGDHRRFTSDAAAGYLRKSLAMDKECQTSIVNYKKGGEAFVNLVTIIPICAADGEDGGEGEVVYYVGLQVDLTAQPNTILGKLRDGSYMVGYEALNPLIGTGGASAKKGAAAGSGGGGGGNNPQAPLTASKALHRLLADPLFVESLAGPPSNLDLDPVEGAGHPLSSMLLTHLPDFVHVVSLKGAFLYVAPAVEPVLGYTPAELVGKSLEEFCHPADVIPVMRELKECGEGKVDLLFRARRKASSSSEEEWVWVECRGRLHVEPGKGRKAIVLSGRSKGMAALVWDDVYRHGGLADSDAWGTISPTGKVLSFFAPASSDSTGSSPIGSSASTPVMASPVMSSTPTSAPSAAYFLGPDATGADMIGHSLGITLSERDTRVFDSMLLLESGDQTSEIPCMFRSGAPGAVVLYRALNRNTSSSPIVFQLKTIPRNPSSMSSSSVRNASLARENVFRELEPEQNTSSWQYELEQMRIQNGKMVEEIAILEQHQHEQSYKHSATSQPPSLPITVPSSISVSNHSPSSIWAGMKRPWDADG